MLTARKISAWRNRWEITLDGQPVTVIETNWRGKVGFELDGCRYEVRVTFWGQGTQMLDESGGVVAATERAGRKHWSVTSAGRTYDFRRGSAWGTQQDFYDGDRQVGSVRRTGFWRSDIAVDLPGMPMSVQIFVLATCLAMWEAQSEKSSSDDFFRHR